MTVMAGVTLVTGDTNYRQDVLLVMSRALCSIQNAVNSVQCLGVKDTVWRIKYAVCSVQCAVCIVQYEECIVKFSVGHMMCAVCSV